MEILPKELYEATVALIPKLDKDSMRKEIYIQTHSRLCM